MKRLFPQSLTIRFVLLTVFTLVTMQLSFGWVMSRMQGQLIQQNMRRNASVMTATLATAAAHHLQAGERGPLESLLRTALHHPNIWRVLVADPTGRVMQGMERRGSGSAAYPAAVTSVTPPGGDGQVVAESADNLMVWEPLVNGEPRGWLQVTYSFGIVQQIKGAIWQKALLLALLWIGLGTLVVVLIMRRPLAAISRLSDFAHQLPEHQGDQVEIAGGSIEIRHLADALNRASRELKIREQQLVEERQFLRIALDELHRTEEKERQLNRELDGRVRERTAQLEESNRELESFCYSVSHDLRAPLRHIDGYSQMIAEDYAERIGEAGAFYLNRMRDATIKMGLLIDDLLQLSRVTRTEIEPSPVNLSAMVSEILAELQAGAPERRAEFQVEEGITAMGDPRLLRVAMDNLLANAWKYSARREATVIAFGRTVKDERPCLFVRDNGAGFDMAYANKLFAAFQRLHRVDEFEGTGVGLATVQRVISRHGGDIWAEAAVDEGATFYFTLPQVE